MEISNREQFNKTFSLEGKIALVLGGGGVLGASMARGLGFAGARVAIADYSEKAALEAAESLKPLGIEAIGIQVDATKADSIRACADATESKLGPIDILVSAVGGNMPAATVQADKTFFQLDEAALKRVVDLNLFAGAMLPAQVIGERMAKRDSPTTIINVSSMNALRPLTRIAGYSAAKAAVSNFTQWLAVYLARDAKSKVRVNAIAPGFFLTNQNRALLTNADGSLSARGNTIIDHTPVGHFGEPDDLIGALVWLASDASSFVTGIVLPIDGGFSAFSGV
ncbi:SDR family oxidoreductase [bacterium]|nr:SDR family oxidoreductase [bacterium]